MTYSHVCHDSFTRVPWLIHRGGTPNIVEVERDMTHSHVWPWRIHMCAMTHSHVPWRIPTCAMTHSHGRDTKHSRASKGHDSFTCVTMTCSHVWPWLMHTCAVTRSQGRNAKRSRDTKGFGQNWSKRIWYVKSRVLLLWMGCLCVLQCAAVYCSVLQCVAVLEYVAVCCSVWLTLKSRVWLLRTSYVARMNASCHCWKRVMPPSYEWVEWNNE